MIDPEDIRKEMKLLIDRFDILDAVIRDTVNQAKKVNQMLKETLDE